MTTSSIIHLSRHGDASGASCCGKTGVWISSAGLGTCRSCLKIHARLDRVAAEQALEDERQNVLATFEQVKKDWEESQHASCRTCDACQNTEAGAAPCANAREGGAHDWDMDLHEPSSAYPTQQITVQCNLIVPQDGYDYFRDVAGRLEQVVLLISLHPGVFGVSTGGPSGSGYIPIEGSRELMAVSE